MIAPTTTPLGIILILPVPPLHIALVIVAVKITLLGLVIVTVYIADSQPVPSFIFTLYDPA